ncbi:MAG: nitronate monooxygenase [Chloroflexota bacterium]|nr:nitronate monooxygenase [Chloroflexota bacterium]
MSTAFTRLVGCDLPIQQAPIGFSAALPELPLAVAAAGGHGMLAGVRMPTSDLAERLALIGARTRAFGVNLIEPLLEDDTLEAAAEHAPLVELYLGAPNAATVERAASGGALVSWQVISGEEARTAEAAGCDVVVARGIEAGGRTKGGIGLLPLLDEVLEAVEVPVIAAGGIATARAVAAVLTAGAAAARIGTRFLAAEEAATHPVYLEALLAASGHDTVLTEAFSAPPAPRSPHRVLRSALQAAERLHDDVVGEMNLGKRRVPVARFAGDNPSADATGHVEAMALYAGQGVGAVRRREPAAAIVADLASRIHATAE